MCSRTIVSSARSWTAIVCGLIGVVSACPRVCAQANENSDPQVIVLHPAQAPDPLLRYRLWPAPQHRRHTNPAPFVSRSVILALQIPTEARKEFDESYGEWSGTPVDQLPVGEVRAVVDRSSAILGELARAERSMDVDYDLRLNELSASETIATLLPEFQEMRHVARILQLRARLAVAEGRFDDAVDDCRIGFRLAEVAAHSTDFLIGRLVGFAISGMMMGVIEEAIQQPECPNLYWALANLPVDRLFEIRDSIEYESVLVGKILDGVENLPDHPIGAEAAREQIRRIVRESQMMLDGTQESHAAMSQLLGGLYVVSLAEPSRELLAQTPQWRDRAAELSAPEAVLRAAQLRLERARDRWVAWSMLPPEFSQEYAKELEDSIGDNGSTDVLEKLVLMLTPAVDAAQRAALRSRQQRNQLIALEALRMHAAVTGELPATIDKLRPVPTWDDPLGHQPFGYTRESATQATLTRAQRWSGDEDNLLKVELKATK